MTKDSTGQETVQTDNIIKCKTGRRQIHKEKCIYSLFVCKTAVFRKSKDGDLILCIKTGDNISKKCDMIPYFEPTVMCKRHTI